MRNWPALAEVRRQVQTPLMLDESLCGMVDAERAVAAGACDLFNLRLSKCGGFIPTLRLAQFAKAHGLACQLGCQVGETAVLSAAGRHFAASVGGLRFLEGSYDRHLVREALGTRDFTFGWGGWAPASARPRPRRDHRPWRPGESDGTEGDAALSGDGLRYRNSYRQRRLSVALPPLRRRRTRAARVVCIHGIQSHGGWYEHSCRRLAEAGFEVFFLDRRGSGLNERDRGDAPGFRRLVKRRGGVLGSAKKEAALKTFMVGISWGGKMAVGVEKRQPGLMDGVALLCPGFYPRVSLSVREKAAVVWARLTRPTRIFPIPLSDPPLFTSTEKWLKFLREDPLTLHQATARFLIASAAFDLYLRDVASHIKVPVLVDAGRPRPHYRQPAHARSGGALRGAEGDRRISGSVSHTGVRAGPRAAHHRFARMVSGDKRTGANPQ